MRRNFLLSLFFSLSLITSCSKKTKEIEPIYSEEEFTKTIHGIEAVNPVGENAIPFAEYSPKVNRLISKTFVYKRLRFYAIGFASVEEARSEARRLNQYYSKNYLLDQIEGEPILEDMAILIFKAQNPNRLVQKVPKSNTHSNNNKQTNPHH